MKTIKELQDTFGFSRQWVYKIMKDCGIKPGKNKKIYETTNGKLFKVNQSVVTDAEAETMAFKLKGGK